MQKLIIIGSGDLGQQLAHIAELQNKYEFVGFLDDYKAAKSIVAGKPVLGKIEDASRLFSEKIFDVFAVGIGYNHMLQRAEIFNTLFSKYPAATLIHPKTNIDPKANILPGAVIYIGTTVDANSTIGNNVLLNAGVTIAHDTVINKHTFVSPGVHMAGFITIEEQCIIGIGATIIDNIKICNNVRIGAGAVVVKNIEKSGVYLGVPARYIKAI